MPTQSSNPVTTSPSTQTSTPNVVQRGPTTPSSVKVPAVWPYNVTTSSSQQQKENQQNQQIQPPPPPTPPPQVRQPPPPPSTSISQSSVQPAKTATTTTPPPPPPPPTTMMTATKMRDLLSRAVVLKARHPIANVCSFGRFLFSQFSTTGISFCNRPQNSDDCESCHCSLF